LDNRPSNLTIVKRNGCFKCGAENHWARNCDRNLPIHDSAEHKSKDLRSEKQGNVIEYNKKLKEVITEYKTIGDNPSFIVDPETKSLMLEFYHLNSNFINRIQGIEQESKTKENDGDLKEIGNFQNNSGISSNLDSFLIF